MKRGKKKESERLCRSARRETVDSTTSQTNYYKKNHQRIKEKLDAAVWPQCCSAKSLRADEATRIDTTIGRHCSSVCFSVNIVVQLPPCFGF